MTYDDISSDEDGVVDEGIIEDEPGEEDIGEI
jgi:hypothetical protein